MIPYIDSFLDRITMYRLVLYLLLGLLALAVGLSAFQLLSFAPLALVLSTGFIVLMSWAANTLLASICSVPSNMESTYITALILALIIDPAKSFNDLPFLGWAALLAISSKYVLAFHKKHFFNPVAIAVVITALGFGASASWWVGTIHMLPAVLIGGLLLVRKLRQEKMVGLFVLAALVATCITSLLQGLPLLKELQQLLLVSPLFFFATIMLTEPLTAPPTQPLKLIYAALVGVLFVPQMHLGSIYSTPELALVLGNVYSYIVSPKQKVLLKLKRKKKIASDSLEFIFKPSRRFKFTPGQYMEFTLAHQKPDSRGTRRYFTLASSPTENDLLLGVRFYPNGSSFKRALSGINSQTPMLAGQIAGDFTLPRDPQKKLVFIAGGIGITPFRSMLKYLIDTGEPRDITLFYINRNASEIVYQDVLGQAALQLGVQVHYVVTNRETLPPNWPGLVGRIQGDTIQSLVPDYQERTYYLSGPPDMVRAYRRMLKTLQVEQSQIKTDFFPGLV